MLQLTARGKESEILNELSKIPSSTAKMVNMYKNRTTLLIIMYIYTAKPARNMASYFTSGGARISIS